MFKTKASKFILKVRTFQLPTVYSFSTAEGETWLWVDSAPPGLNRVKASKIFLSKILHCKHCEKFKMNLFVVRAESKFCQNLEILGLHFCANMKLRTQPAILAEKSLIFPDWNVLHA